MENPGCRDDVPIKNILKTIKTAFFPDFPASHV
jgi:hypothetical protein